MTRTKITTGSIYTGFLIVKIIGIPDNKVKRVPVSQGDNEIKQTQNAAVSMGKQEQIVVQPGTADLQGGIARLIARGINFRGLACEISFSGKGGVTIGYFFTVKIYLKRSAAYQAALISGDT